MQNHTVNSSLLDSSSVKKTPKNKTQDVFYNAVDPVPFVKCFGFPQKCPQCCTNSGCRGQTAKFLEEMVKPRGKAKGDLHFERGLHASLQNEAPSPKVTSGSEWLCKPGQEPALQRGIASSDTKVGSGKSGCLVLPILLQPVIPSTKTQQKWMPILDLIQLNPFLWPGTFKIETQEIIWLSLQRGEWVTSLDFSDAYFHIPIHQRSRKYLRFFLMWVFHHTTKAPD